MKIKLDLNHVLCVYKSFWIAALLLRFKVCLRFQSKISKKFQHFKKCVHYDLESSHFEPSIFFLNVLK